MTIACRRSGAPTPVSYPKERWESVRLESAAFEREFDLLVLSGQDRGWTYELFSPALIAWLTDRAPGDLAFELNEGWLCVMQPGEPGDPDAIEALCGAAAHLAGRLREEALEEEDDPDLLTFAANTKRMDDAIAKVDWERPPASAAEAIAAYRRVASRNPAVLLAALLGSLVGLALGGGVGFLLGGILGVVPGVVIGAIGGWKVVREIGTEKRRFEGSISYVWAGVNAFNRQYATSRGLERERIAQFHHDNRDFPVPGKAESVQRGAIPGSGLVGSYVMVSDSPELRAAGAVSMSAADGRPLSADALVAELPAAADPAAVASLDLAEGYSAAAYGANKVAVWRPIAGNMARTAAGCDEFRQAAGRAIGSLAGA